MRKEERTCPGPSELRKAVRERGWLLAPPCAAPHSVLSPRSPTPVPPPRPPDHPPQGCSCLSPVLPAQVPVRSGGVLLPVPPRRLDLQKPLDLTATALCGGPSRACSHSRRSVTVKPWHGDGDDLPSLFPESGGAGAAASPRGRGPARQAEEGRGILMPKMRVQCPTVAAPLCGPGHLTLHFSPTGVLKG